MDSHTYAPTTVNKLLMLSLARCMNPDCQQMLVVQRDVRLPLTGPNSLLTKNIAHVHSEQPKGPRYDPSLSIDDLRAYTNLVLLCPACHKRIDEFPDDFPASVVERWREMREAEALRSFHGNSSLLAKVVSAIAREGAFDLPVGIEAPPLPYTVVDKIAYNELSASAWLIREYAAYAGALRALYAQLEEQSPHLKTSLLRFIAMQYQKAKNAYASSNDTSLIEIVRQHSDEILEAVHTALVDVVEVSAPSLSYEEIQFGTLIVVVDAFIDCRVLESPV